jgi:hypothetical protein
VAKGGDDTPEAPLTGPASSPSSSLWTLEVVAFWYTVS